MSFTSISRAAVDQDLINRVTSAAHQLVQSDADKANTILGQALLSGTGLSQATVLMWPVAIDTEQAYESALLNQRGAPGYDVDIITDASIFASVNAHWPMTRPPTPPAAP